MILDQAKTCGFAVFDDNKLIDYGTLELGRQKDLYEDILFFAQRKIENLIDKSKADIIILEDIQQQNGNVSTYKKLALLMGSLICLFQKKELLYQIVPATRWKSFCGIRSKKRIAQKPETIRFVEDKFGLTEVTSDMADAIAMGHYAVNNIKIEEGCDMHNGSIQNYN